MSCHPFTHSIDIYSETFSREAYVISFELFYCTFVLGDIVHLLSYLFVSHCFIQSMRKKKKQKQKQKQKKKDKKKKQKEKKRQKKREKKKIYMNKCARICVHYKYSLSSYVDL